MYNFVPYWEDLESTDMDFVLQTFDNSHINLNGDEGLADLGAYGDLAEDTPASSSFEDSLFGHLVRNQWLS
jgi:hypothetical protein